MTKILLSGSLGLYIVSLILPSFLLKGQPFFAWPGIGVLALGWLGILAGQFAWFANPCALLAVIFLSIKHTHVAQICSVLAMLLACNCFLFREMPNGIPIPLVLGPGAFSWLASIAMVLIASFEVNDALSVSFRR